MKLHKVLSVSLALTIGVPLVNAQLAHSSSPVSGRGWTSNPFEHFVFVENKGQFDLSLPGLNTQFASAVGSDSEIDNLSKTGDEKNKILFYAYSKGVEVYFSSSRLVYRHDEYKSLVSERQREKMEKEGRARTEKIVDVKHHYLDVEWIGTDPSVILEGSDAQVFYYTYPDEKDNGRTTLKAGCYKKITYKNLYPNIDVEYILPEKGGVKYSLILHSGADLSKVKMRYNGAKALKTDKEGNVIISTAFGDFVDHAPISFYADNYEAILSSFSVKNNIVSFNIDQPGTRNPEPGTIVIDPWTFNPAFPVNRSYDVNYDMAGNVYICGSGSTTQSYKLAKFNSAGALQWVFTTNIGPNLGGTCYGDFAVDEITGTTYLLGMWPAGIKVNTLGIQTGGYSPAIFPSLLEMWRCEYSRCLNKIVVGTGSMGGPYQAGMLDTALTSYVPVNSYSAPGAQVDVAILTIDPNSSFCYMATASGGSVAANRNAIVKLPIPNLLPRIWGPVADGHSFIEVGSITYTPNIPVGPYSNGFNGMACGPRFLYTYDGSVLKKWNKNTGAFIAQVNTGGTMFATGGLSADKCDNVYAGVGNVIKAYNSSLVQIATYPVANTCYDVKLGPNNKLYACGVAFVTQIDVPALPLPTATSTPASVCSACDGTATAHPCGDPAGYNYSWSSGGQAQTATGLCPGTYTVSITYACSDVDVVTVSVPGGVGGITLSSIQTNLCSNVGTVTMTASGGATPYTYLWSNGQTVAALTGLAAGTYTVTATDANGCSTFKAITIANTINVSSTSKYSGCAGGSTGSITLNVAGGSPSYTYAWSNGQTGVTATGLAAGTYSATVTDANGCAQTIVSTLPGYSPLTIQTEKTVICAGTTGQATVVSVAGGTPSFSYSWSNGQFTPSIMGSAGTYIVRVTDANGCTVTGSVTIAPGPDPANASFTRSPTGTICKGTTVNFTNTGTTGTLVTHKWIIPGQGPIVTGVVTDFTSYFLNLSYTFTSAGTYTVKHIVSYPSGGCADTIATTITVINCTGPVVAATGSSVCPGVCATVTSSTSSGTAPYTYLW
ncbi:MAG: SprB repeat-containing protein, partial [Bacteroidia bacterium]|nr:SprB repeat-containing protein [Bacteroidia bacterium]